ncbi:glycosyltransferase [Patescibacteria group bacterium]|nr:glycosyltransferase [Patescibacteria group bacterium]
MRIGIDISQIAFEGTGVARYVRGLVMTLLEYDRGNEYVLFGASLRKRAVFHAYFSTLRRLSPRVSLIVVPIPPTLLDIFWNLLHIVPVEWFIGSVDVFWSSDWTQPPLTRARGVTTIHDVSFLKFPEQFDKRIIAVQKRRLTRAVAVCSAIFCDSEATKRDVQDAFTMVPAKLHVVYPGFSPI